MLSQAFGFAFGGVILFLLITIDPSEMPESRTYDALATYLHCSVSLVYFFYLLIKAISNLGWILLQLCDADFDH